MSRADITQLAATLGRLGSDRLRVHPLQCIHVRHRRAECALCADSCPTRAIIWTPDLEVYAERCTGCGICAAVCPTGALEPCAPTDGELAARLNRIGEARDAVAFACARHLKGNSGTDGAVIRVGCLSRIDESILLAAAAAGIQRIWLIDGLCHSCPQVAGHAVAGKAVQRAAGLLQASGGSQSITFVPGLPVELRGAGLPGVAAGDPAEREADAADPPFRRGWLPARLPEKRRLLLAAWRRLARPAMGHPAAAQWAQLILKESCTGCQMCAFFCPTGALSRVRDDGQRCITYTPAYCAGCHLCEKACFWHAIEIVPAADLGKAFDGSSEVLAMPVRGEVRGPNPTGGGLVQRVWAWVNRGRGMPGENTGT